jgi:hypothetical protein
VPIPFAPLLAFVLGVVLAWVSRNDLARTEGPLIASRQVLVATALAFLVYAPIVGYFVAFHGDWSYLYIYPHSRIPSAIDLALVLLASAQIPLAFVFTVPAARAKRFGVAVWLAGVPAVVATGLFAWASRRLSVSGTYAQFHRGFGVVPIGASTLGRGVLFMMMVGALAVFWSVRSVGRISPPALLRRGSIDKPSRRETSGP